jgi:DNA replication and repair protein RecF
MNSDTGRVETGSRLHVRRLQLSDFRNYENMSLYCDARHVVLTGENGAGKTNILEALSFLSPGRGLRRAAYDMIARKEGSGTWSIFAEIAGANDVVSIGTGIQPGNWGPESQRRLHIDMIPAKNSEALLDHLRVVWLTPAMDGLFSGPAAERRKFLDRLVLAINPAHGRHVAGFERAMRSRNRLLGESSPDSSWLDAIEEQMTALAASVQMARQELLALLTRLIDRVAQPQSPFPDANLSLDGGYEDPLLQSSGAEFEAQYRDRLRDMRRTDAAAGRTTEGPHRSDLRVVHMPKAMPARHCSTGEQKALLIGIVLAHAQLVRETSGHAPLVLLDEVAAHLDIRRRAALFDRIELLGTQAWMTGTDRELFDALGERASYWHIADGTIATE